MKLQQNILDKICKVFLYVTIILILNSLFISCFINRDQIVVYKINNTKYVLNNGISIISAAPGSSSKIITEQTPYKIFFDINKDGKKDLISIITQETGGSGVFYYLAITLTSSVRSNALNAKYIGDRLKIKTLKYYKNQISLEYFERSVNTPFTAKPDLYKSIKYIVINNELIESN